MKNKELKRYTLNTSWMLFEKILSLGLGLIATVLLARSLGPADFGIFNYALSLVALLGIFCHLGLNGLAVKEFKEAPEKTSETVTTIFTLKLVMAAFAFVVLVLITWATTTSLEHILAILIIGLTLFAKPFETFNHWFQAQVLAKLGAISYLTGQGIGNTLKISVALTGLPLLYVAGAQAAMLTVTALMLLVLFINYGHKSLVLTFSSPKAKELLQKGAWIFLGSMTAIVYLKMDQIMLQHMAGDSAVGRYAAAARLSEAWYFIPTTLMASLFPKLLEKRTQSTAKYHHFLQLVLDGLFIVAILLTISILFLSDYIIAVLYGDQYEISASILRVHILACLFIFMRALFSKWIIAEQLFKISLITQGLGALSNIALNYILIQEMGAIGAAWATLISYSIASYFSLIFHPKSRLFFWLMTKTFLFHWIITTINLLKYRSRYLNAY